MHSKSFTKEEKAQLQEIAKHNKKVANALITLSKKAKTKEEKTKRVLAKDICVAVLRELNKIT